MTSIRESADKASAYAGEKLREASDKVRQASEKVRETASVARERTSDVIEDNPLVVIAGGLAVGALVAALLPRSRTEGNYLGKIGDQITKASQERLSELGLTRDNARAKVGKLIDSAVEAVSGQSSAREDA